MSDADVLSRGVLRLLHGPISWSGQAARGAVNMRLRQQVAAFLLGLLAGKHMLWALCLQSATAAFVLTLTPTRSAPERDPQWSGDLGQPRSTSHATGTGRNSAMNKCRRARHGSA